MKKTLKTIALFLMAALVIVSCIGCGNNKKKKPGEVLSGELELTMPEYDLGDNKSVKVLSHDASVFSKAKEAFEQAYSGTFEVDVVPFDNLKTKFVNGIMSNDAHDLARSFSTAIVKRNFIVPVTDYIDINTNLWENMLPLMDSWKYNNKYYNAFVAQECTTCWWYNAEIFEEYGEKTPVEYLNEDNWTWDTMRDLAKRLTIDKDGDGAIDQYGACLEQPWNLLTSTGRMFLDYDENGNAKNALTGERVTRTMNFYQNLSVKDKVLGGNETQFIQGKVAMLQSAMWIAVKFPEQKEAGTFHIMPDPKDPLADKYYIPDFSYNWVIPAGAKNPKGAAALLCTARFLVAQQENKERNGGEVETYDFYKGCEQCKEVTADMRNNHERYTPASQKDFTIYELSSISYDMWWGMGILDGKPWSAIAEQLNPIVDEAISRADDQSALVEEE